MYISMPENKILNNFSPAPTTFTCQHHPASAAVITYSEIYIFIPYNILNNTTRNENFPFPLICVYAWNEICLHCCAFSE